MSEVSRFSVIQGRVSCQRVNLNQNCSLKKGNLENKNNKNKTITGGHMSNSYYLLSGHDGRSVWMAVKSMAAPAGLGKRADRKDEAGSRLQSQGNSKSLLRNCLVERICFMEEIASHIP